jgi:hypothetical protein
VSTSPTPVIPPHPAKFSAAIVDHLGDRLAKHAAAVGRPIRVLDPFAGVGGVHRFATDDILTLGVELEPEWAAAHPRTLVGDATNLPPCWSELFDVVATSPAYGNRLADSYMGGGPCGKCNDRRGRAAQVERKDCDRCGGTGRDLSTRMTYRCGLGRDLTPGSGAGLNWGDQYRELHAQAWQEVRRVLAADGLFLLNVKNHVRRGREMPVVEWHLATVASLGFTFEGMDTIETPGMRHGANADLRAKGEVILVFRKAAP